MWYSKVEQLLIEKDDTGLISLRQALESDKNIRSNILESTISATKGDYLQVLLTFGREVSVYCSQVPVFTLNDTLSIPPFDWSLSNLNQIIASDPNAVFTIRRSIIDTLTAFSLRAHDPEVFNAMVFQFLLFGVSAFELFCQANYTGPELHTSIVEQLGDNSLIWKQSIQLLECDGQYTYRSCQIPHTLLLARIIVSTLADIRILPWKSGIELNEAGVVVRKLETPSNSSELLLLKQSLNERFFSLEWWSVRSAIVHARTLQPQSEKTLPTLWAECSEDFSRLLLKLYHDEGSKSSQDVKQCVNVVTTSIENIRNSWKSTLDTGEVKTRQLRTMLHLEWGLCCHYFSYGDKGKKQFSLAKDAASLQLRVDAALGKRTKYQREDIAQLYLYAKSGFPASLPASLPAEPSHTLTIQEDKAGTVTNAAKDSTDNELLVDNAEVDHTGTAPEIAVNGDTPRGDWEVGRRTVKEAAGGEEAAAREVMLDSVDTGAAENIILEGGPKFAGTQLSGEFDMGGVLHPLDQAVVLAYCLDVNNSNPVDGLTNEQMTPYIERVLKQPANWMIHSTALLERSWIEYERRKTMDRAMLQVQALLDQHTTKLTYLQSTYESVEQSAPVQERLKYLYQLIYPAQYELKHELAKRYLRAQVFASALKLFRELELWDDVVTCYQLMGKPQRAELVVRERLKEAGETPYMLTSLADLTQNESLYLKAWELSCHRYPRAKRTLGKICYDRGDFSDCVTHFTDALAVQPLVATAWFMKGIACMRLQLWNDSIQAFVRCVQQDSEMGEAYANMGAVFMYQKEWSKALDALTEAYKMKRESWRVVENIMLCSVQLARWKEVVRHMHTLLDMRAKSQRPIHMDELRRMCYLVSKNAQREWQLSLQRAKSAVPPVESTVSNENSVKDELMNDDKLANPESNTPVSAIVYPLLDQHYGMNVLEDLQRNDEVDAAEVDEEVLYEVQQVNPVVDQVHSLLQRITETVKTNAEVWDVFADFQHSLGKFSAEIDTRMKQLRALNGEVNWEKDEEKVQQLVKAVIYTVDTHKYSATRKPQLYSCKMFLQSTLRKLETLWKDTKYCNSIKLMIEHVEKTYSTMK